MRPILFLGAALAACASAPNTVEPRLELPPVPVHDGFVLRQEIHFRYQEHAGSFEAVVQNDCGVLTIVGLTPIGSRAFTLVQRGGELSIEAAQPPPFPPEFVVRDVHRVFLVPLPETAPETGERELSYGAERVRERWAGGVLRERIFASRVREGDGVAVHYRDGQSRDRPARSITLENHDLGYALDLVIHEQRNFSCGG